MILKDLIFGDIFQYKTILYILSQTYNQNNKKLAINLIDGSTRWFEDSCIVNIMDLYFLDGENNIVSIKQRISNAIDT